MGWPPCDDRGMAPRRDFRKLDPATQAELRRVAVAMVETGKTRVEAAAAVGVNRRFVGEWAAAVRRAGKAALAGGRRGRRPGEQKALSGRQEQRVRRLITDKCPDGKHEDSRGADEQEGRGRSPPG